MFWCHREALDFSLQDLCCIFTPVEREGKAEKQKVGGRDEVGQEQGCCYSSNKSTVCPSWLSVHTPLFCRCYRWWWKQCSLISFAASLEWLCPIGHTNIWLLASSYGWFSFIYFLFLQMNFYNWINTLEVTFSCIVIFPRNISFMETHIF